VLNEIERNLQDAMQVVRNVHFDPRMLPGGGATELAVSTAITKSLDTVEGACAVRVVVAMCCAVLLAVVTAMELLNASLN
jgi:chaperonin GroEL (HSP60 family)